MPLQLPRPRAAAAASRVPAATRWLTRLAIAAATLATVSAPAAAQSGLVSGDVSVDVNVSKHASLTLAITGGATQSLANITDGALNPFPTPVTFVTTWDVRPHTAGFQVVASFASADDALLITDGTEGIASSRVEGSVPGGVPVSFTPFTQTVTGGVAGAGLVLVDQPLTPPTRRGTRTDDLWLQLNLVGADPITVGDYAGVLTLRAITQ